MPRDDYNRLLAYFSEHKDELLPYEALTMETRMNYPHMICRISDSRTWLDVTNEENCDLGVFVDIYPMDGLGNSYGEAMEIMKKTTPNCSLIFLAARKYYHFGNTKGWKKRLIKIPAFIYTHIMGQKYFVNKVKAIVKDLDYDKSSYIGCASWATNPQIELMKKEWFEERVKAKFEDSEFYIPKEYDKVLLYEDLVCLKDVKIDIIKTSHDTTDSRGFVLESKGKSVVYLTDTGFINQKNFNKIKNKNIYLFESNHDIEMLLNGPYPKWLKDRVMGPYGHLSNKDSAIYLAKNIGENTEKIMLMHLSHKNNTEEKALETIKEIFNEYEISFNNITCAKQKEKSELMVL